MLRNTLFKGLGVTPGIVNSKIYIAESTDDLLSCPKGCIMLIHSATPDIILAFENAAAIVTEYGGLTSHAAILAREFGKPCVVSAKGIFDFNLNGYDATLDGQKGLLQIRDWR
jgi:phosphohistidine swiveling domain-containing protein